MAELADKIRKEIVSHVEMDWRKYLSNKKMFNLNDWITVSRKETADYIHQQFKSRSTDYIAKVYVRKKDSFISEVVIEEEEKEDFPMDYPEDGNPWKLSKKEIEEQKEKIYQKWEQYKTFDDSSLTIYSFTQNAAFKVTEIEPEGATREIETKTYAVIEVVTEGDAKGVIISTISTVKPGGYIHYNDGTLTVGSSNGVNYTTNCDDKAPKEVESEEFTAVTKYLSESLGFDKVFYNKG